MSGCGWESGGGWESQRRRIINRCARSIRQRQRMEHEGTKQEGNASIVLSACRCAVVGGRDQGFPYEQTYPAACSRRSLLSSTAAPPHKDANPRCCARQRRVCSRRTLWTAAAVLLVVCGEFSGWERREIRPMILAHDKRRFSIIFLKVKAQNHPPTRHRRPRSMSSTFNMPYSRHLPGSAIGVRTVKQGNQGASS